MAKSLRCILFCGLIFLILFCVASCSEPATIESSYWVSECLVELDGLRYEILVNRENQRTYFVTNDLALQERVVSYFGGSADEVLLESPIQGSRMFQLYSYPRSPSARFSDPELLELEGVDTLRSVIPDGFVYLVLYEDSLRYIRYLLDSGYAVYASCLTGSCFEVYLCSEDGVYLRCAVFPDQLWCAELYDSGNLPTVLSFMSHWDFNGVLSQLFEV